MFSDPGLPLVTENRDIETVDERGYYTSLGAGDPEVYRMHRESNLSLPTIYR